MPKAIREFILLCYLRNLVSETVHFSVTHCQYFSCVNCLNLQSILLTMFVNKWLPPSICNFNNPIS
ncbi:mCG59842 [Mus musculus]|nr:mCG59842 [Mus musculus]